MTLFDSHCHPQFPQYDQDRDEVIKRAQAAGVKMICVGTDLEDSQKAIALAEKYPEDVWATVGVHPMEIKAIEIKTIEIKEKADTNSAIAKLVSLAANPRVVAIGECGLDYYRLEPAQSKSIVAGKQKELFLAQIKIAQELNKPLMIHCRPSKGTMDAYEDLTMEAKLPYIVHFFVGSVEVAKKLLELGCYFTFGGVITFTRDYDEVIKFLPLERILLETDAPFVAPELYRGQRNEPAYVIEVAKKIAEIKTISLEKVISQTTKNSRQIFKVLVTSE